MPASRPRSLIVMTKMLALRNLARRRCTFSRSRSTLRSLHLRLVARTLSRLFSTYRNFEALTLSRLRSAYCRREARSASGFSSRHLRFAARSFSIVHSQRQSLQRLM